jgi:DNA-binding winged helix-turn-helix (wHTH) protein
VKVFGEFELDEKLMQLSRGGSAVPLSRQCLDLLVLMLDRPGQTVTREEIRRTLWADSNVDFDHGLDVLINRLRVALGDSSKSPRYVQTVPTKGYRFIGDVSLEPSGLEVSTTPGRMRRFARYAAVALFAAFIAILIAHALY